MRDSAFFEAVQEKSVVAFGMRHGVSIVALLAE